MITVWIKAGVLGDLQPIMQKALGKIIRLYERKGATAFYITSIREGNHCAGSFHFIGLAMDFRKRHGITKEMIQLELGPDYDVIEEEDHFHVEYDPKQ